MGSSQSERNSTRQAPSAVPLNVRRYQALLFSLGTRRHRLHDAAEIEAAGLLARWKLLEALQPLPDIGRSRRIRKHVLNPPALIAHRIFLSGTLKRVHTQVGQQRCAEFIERLLPHPHAFRLLLQESDLPVLVASGSNVAVIRPVDEFFTW